MKLLTNRRKGQEGGGAGSDRQPTPAVQQSEPAPEPQPATPKRHRRPNPRLFVLLALVAAGATWWYFTEVAAPPPTGITASGTIEATEVSIASEVAGRVTQVLVEEGEQVHAGDLLVKLDDSVPSLQLRMASTAERQLLELQLEKTSILSPMDGFVTRSSIHQGEVATPGSTLMTVAQLEQVELTLYVPEREVGRVKLGQQVKVLVDAFPNEPFSGEVTFISTRAEFTPRNVQTQKDRLNLVFAVKVRIPNPDLRLKPGMPADAIISYE